MHWVSQTPWAGWGLAQRGVWLLSRMKILRWRWSSISCSAQAQLKGALALLFMGNVAFVIAQVSGSPRWGFLGSNMVQHAAGGGDAASRAAPLPLALGSHQQQEWGVSRTLLK